MRHLVFIAALAASFITSSVTADTPKPNIVFIYADDWGWGDLSCHGAEDWIRTPRIDQLANEGIDFAQFNVLSPVCSPSRVGAMTGQYPGRYGINNVFNGAELGPKKSGTMPDWLNPKAPTLPRFLKSAGYYTVHMGKWHMGAETRLAPDAPEMSAYGIDESKVYHGPGPGINQREIGIEAARAIERMKGKQPFYLNVWLHESHTQHFPTQESLAAFKHLDPRRQVYAAVLRDGDNNVGLVLESLKKNGMDQNTIVIFSSDNGPAGEAVNAKDRLPTPEDGDIKNGFNIFYSVGSTGGLRARKGQLFEGGVRTPFIVRWPGHTPEGMKNEKTVLTAIDLLPTLCAAAGVTLPADYKPDGENLIDAFNGKPVQRTKPFFWKYYHTSKGADTWPAWAMREGQWKLLMDEPGTQVALYDLSNDRREQNELSESHPEIVARMKAQLNSWIDTLPTSADPTCISKTVSTPKSSVKKNQ